MDTDPRKTIRDHDIAEEPVPRATIRDLRTRLAKRFPIMAKAQPRGGWVGAYDVTPDSYPIIDEFRPEGLFIAVGFSGHGFKLSPAIGRLTAEYIDVQCHTRCHGKRMEDMWDHLSGKFSYFLSL